MVERTRSRDAKARRPVRHEARAAADSRSARYPKPAGNAARRTKDFSLHDTAHDKPLVLFLCEPGLAGILTRELKYRAVIRQKARPEKFNLRNYDLLVFPEGQVIGDVVASRVALHALQAPVFGRHSVTEGQLDRLAAWCIKERPDALVSSVSGAAFQRHDLLRWITKQLHVRGAAIRSQDEPVRPAWLFVVDEAFWIGFQRLNHHEKEGRAGEAVRAGALPDTLAAAMVFMAHPREREVIWDPVMGSGTLLSEAAALAPHATLIGTDIDADAVALARARLGGRRETSLFEGDSRVAELGRNDVSITVANLPWGHQFQSAEPIWRLYEGILHASIRHAVPNWRGCFLTTDTQALSRAADAVGGLTIESTTRVRVRGIEAEISLLRR